MAWLGLPNLGAQAHALLASSRVEMVVQSELSIRQAAATPLDAAIRDVTDTVDKVIDNTVKTMTNWWSMGKKALAE